MMSAVWNGRVFEMKLRNLIALLLILSMLGTGTASAEQVSSSTVLPALKTVVDRDHIADYDFSGKAMEYLNYIGENFPDRDGDGDARDAFTGWLVSELKACGYTDSQIEEQPFESENLFAGDTVQGRNIIVTLPGQREGQLIVGAHYDGTGLGDNGSGTALLLAAAAGLVNAGPQFTIRFIFFDREEAGMIGSRYYAEQMSENDIASTLYMINLDALAFGDFCNIYGGVFGDDYDSPFLTLVEDEPLPEPDQLEGYNFAAETAEALGFKVYHTGDLDGYFEENGEGMKAEDNAFFTNPWTNAHPAPLNMFAPSPATFGASDHAPFAALGIPYIYFEATNWWAEGSDEYLSYTGYIETYDAGVGDGGQFMNTDWDTLENLNALFPGRAEQHFRMYSPLLSALLLVE